MLTAYGLYGAWAETGERFADSFDATSSRSAEDLAQMTAREKGGTLLVCRLVAPPVVPADTYTAFVDPNDIRNADRDDLEADMPCLEGDPEWTVFGIAASKGTIWGDHHLPLKGERYGDVVNATSAGAAEDVARARMADNGGVLFVCTVLPGRVPACDTYASFVNPDVQPA